MCNKSKITERLLQHESRESPYRLCIVIVIEPVGKKKHYYIGRANFSHKLCPLKELNSTIIRKNFNFFYFNL